MLHIRDCTVKVSVAYNLSFSVYQCGKISLLFTAPRFSWPNWILTRFDSKRNAHETREMIKLALNENAAKSCFARSRVKNCSPENNEYSNTSVKA